MKRAVSIVLLIAIMLCPIAGIAGEKLPSCIALYAMKGEATNYEVSLVTCSPLDNYLCISVRVSYIIPKNYEVTGINIYINNEPTQQLTRLSQNIFCGMLEIPQSHLSSLRITPVATTSYAAETTSEELTEDTIELFDFKKISGTACFFQAIQAFIFGYLA